MSGLKRKIRRNAQRLANQRGQQIINRTPLTRDELLLAGGVPRPDGVIEDITQPVKYDKGEKGGSCNRTACQQPGADWFNHSTRRYYCGSCAVMLNRDANLFRGRDSFLDRLGHDLCTLDLPVGEVTDPDDLVGRHSHAARA